MLPGAYISQWIWRIYLNWGMRRRTPEDETMKLTGFLLSAGLAASLACGAAYAQDAGQDMKDAGHATKDAAKDTGQATKAAAKDTGQATKKAYHKTADATDRAADKTANGARDAGHDTKVAAKTTGRKTKAVTKTTVHRTQNAGDALAGKPEEHPQNH
jgi:hypothetical protein